MECKVTFAIVPPGGGEAEYTVDEVALPNVPEEGDPIEIYQYQDDPNHGVFVVRRRTWQIALDGTKSSLIRVHVEIEYARGAVASPSHMDMCDKFEAMGRTVKSVELSGF